VPKDGATISTVSGDTAPYLGYLSKEMTIMGILSTFCIASAGLVLKSTTSGQDDGWLHAIWDRSESLVSAGCAALVIAAYLFYRQRSMLAWHYGQISLAMVPGGHPYQKSLNSLIVDADTWSTWISYRIAKNFMFLGFAEYGLILVRDNLHWQWIDSKCSAIAVPTILVIAMSAINWRLMWAFEQEDSPVAAAIESPKDFVFKNWPWNRHREDL
jgi:hypothetical protein